MTIYFDMDGVLADFAQCCSECDCLTKNSRPNWEKIDGMGGAFWEKLDWAADAKDMFTLIKNRAEIVGCKIKVLGTFHSDADRLERIKWCAEKLGLAKKSIQLVKDHATKRNFASGSVFLIDDHTDDVQTFTYAGGIGVLHENCELTTKKIMRVFDGMEKYPSDDADDCEKILRSWLIFLLNEAASVKYTQDDYEKIKSAFLHCYEIMYSSSHDENALLAELSSMLDGFPCANFSLNELRHAYENPEKQHLRKVRDGKKTARFDGVTMPEITLSSDEWRRQFCRCMTYFYIQKLEKLLQQAD